jgi:hypothetical protein
MRKLKNGNAGCIILFGDWLELKSVFPLTCPADLEQEATEKTKTFRAVGGRLQSENESTRYSNIRVVSCFIRHASENHVERFPGP